MAEGLTDFAIVIRKLTHAVWKKIITYVLVNILEMYKIWYKLMAEVFTDFAMVIR